MTETAFKDKEAHGANFSLSAMVRAQEKTFEAVKRIAATVRPGMSEHLARELAQDILEGMGMERLWHKNLVRLGPSTLMTFFEEGDPDYVLGENDLFFVDLGVVWEGHEGDAGDTFVVGKDEEMHACAEAARVLWVDVAGRWRAEGLSGEALYDYASERAQAMGWKLNLEVRGHRVCDFPHAIYRAGSLGDFGLCPTTGLWVLEIQIAHPSRPFGAFYEDLLIGDVAPSAG